MEERKADIPKYNDKIDLYKNKQTNTTAIILILTMIIIVMYDDDV